MNNKDIMRKLKFDISSYVGYAIVEIEDDDLTEEQAIEKAEEALANANFYDDPCYGVKVITDETQIEPDVTYRGMV